LPSITAYASRESIQSCNHIRKDMSVASSMWQDFVANLCCYIITEPRLDPLTDMQRHSKIKGTITLICTDFQSHYLYNGIATKCFSLALKNSIAEIRCLDVEDWEQNQ
jgi:hypothetical protein